MSETKHTPGPWEVLKGPAGWIQTVGSPYGHGQMHVADARGWGHLTGTGACHFSQEKAAEIQDANAALIAAAPELLVALREVTAGLVAIGNSRGVAHPLTPPDVLGRQNAALAELLRLIDMAQAAIAKAEPRG